MDAVPEILGGQARPVEDPAQGVGGVDGDDLRYAVPEQIFVALLEITDRGSRCGRQGVQFGQAGVILLAGDIDPIPVTLSRDVDQGASDGYTVSFDAKRLARNGNIILAYKVNDNPLTEKYFPMRLVGSDLQKNEMAGMVTKIVVKLPAKPASVSNVPAGEATFILTGLVNQELTLNEAALRALEVKKITAEHPKKGKEEYEGVALNALLDLAGLKDGAKTLLVTAADGYTAEIDLAAVRACADCLLGFTTTAEKFKMVMPGLESNFWVKDVVKIEVK